MKNHVEAQAAGRNTELHEKNLAERVSSCSKIVYILSELCDAEHSLLFKYVFYL